MVDFLSRLFRLEQGEWPRLLQFGLFGFLLQMGMGVGFSAGDAAFLTHVGADRLPLVFMATPAVMLVYTLLFSYLLARFSIDRIVDFTLAALVIGGVGFSVLIGTALPDEWQASAYFALKLYLVMWYIALYSLFWNYTDTYFDIQEAKRLFPLFAAFCALGTATGALIVSLFADAVPVRYFLLLWAAVAAVTFPLAWRLRRRWQKIAESDDDLDDESTSPVDQLVAVGKAFGTSRYTMVFTATLFVTLLMTNLAEYQYSMVLQQDRSEAELAALFGKLYAASNLFNLVICLFVFNRLAARLGVRNVAFILPLTYFAVFGWFFLQGGTSAALAAFFAYHGVLTSIEYNNQNLMFNAVPSRVKRPLRTVVEGLAEPLASLVAGGFLLYAASHLDMRELSGVGIIVGMLLIAIVIMLRQLYPAAMVANMRQGWMNFGARAANGARFDPNARARLEQAAAGTGVQAQRAGRLLAAGSEAARAAPPSEDIDALVARLHEAPCEERAGAAAALAARASRADRHIVSRLAARLPELDQEERRTIIELLGRIGDSEAIGDILSATAALAPRDRRAVAAILANIGETAIPRLIAGTRDRTLPYRSRVIAARALADISHAQFAAQLDGLVRDELGQAARLHDSAAWLASQPQDHGSLGLLVRAQRERVGAALDFVLELLAIGGWLPNFDLLIVSLHSANAKVRGNAIEAIESGIDGGLFRLIAPLLHRRSETSGADRTGRDIGCVLDAALASGQPIEMTLAADILHAQLDGLRFAGHMQRVIRAGMPEVLRGHLLDLMGFDGARAGRRLDRLAALAAHPDVGGATLETLLVLAERAEDREPAQVALHARTRSAPFWISDHDLQDVAGRFPDLALVFLRSRGGQRHAA